MDIDKRKVGQWLETHWTGSHRCPICQGSNWTLMDKAWELREFQGGSFVIGGQPILPVVALMCNVCGYTILFNAIAVGAVERPAPQEEQDER
jgi:hypothetical protein